MRTIKATSPPMRGKDVKRLQKALATNPFGRKFGYVNGFGPGPIDGEAGPKTLAACKRAKYCLGYARTTKVGGAKLLAYLEKRRLIGPAMRIRRAARILKYNRNMTPTKRLLKVADYWYAHRAQTRYSYPDHNMDRMKCPHFPGVAPWTDCSGMIRCMWQQLGWPDPAGAGYAVWGNSDSFIAQARAHGKLIPLGQEKAGDIACYVGGVGHAELVVRRGVVLTNGSEAGPYYKPIAQHSGKLYICRLAPFV